MMQPAEVKPARKKPGRKPFDPAVANLTELRHKMTPKQWKLAEVLAQGGLSKISAYRTAYGTKRRPGDPSHGGERTEAARVAAHPCVSRATDILQEVYSRPALRDAASTRAFVLGKLHSLANDAEAEQVQLAATVKLGETSHVGLFVSRSEIVHRDGPAVSLDLEAELVSRLAAIAGHLAPSQPVIEVSSSQKTVLSLSSSSTIAADQPAAEPVPQPAYPIDERCSD